MAQVEARWQQQMEERLRDVERLTNEAMLQGIDSTQANVRAQLAIANGLAALTYAVALHGSDLTTVLSSGRFSREETTAFSPDEL